MSSNTPSSASTARKAKKIRKPHKLILCFDGTGNKFSGRPEDTNIVKLFKMCDREGGGQFHYYQPGIGTYIPSDSESLNPGFFGRGKRWFRQTVDQGIAQTFDQHVIAGYRFLMRYYKEGDLIYIFGFSRGGFTARFLASLITNVGLLSKGNEELVPFAYERYLEHTQIGVKDILLNPFKTEKGQSITIDPAQYMGEFKSTFCRPNVAVEFLGLFDAVSSVALFDPPGSSVTTLPALVAKNIRHAVSLDERRTKFKPALIQYECDHVHAEHEHEKQQQAPCKASSQAGANEAKISSIEEVWFVGNHGDVGGGWCPETVQIKHNDRTHQVKTDAQLSDFALEWMIKEIKSLEEKGLGTPINFNAQADDFLESLDQPGFGVDTENKAILYADGKPIHTDKGGIQTPATTWTKRDLALRAKMHDPLRFGGGCAVGQTLFWWFLELCPGLMHMELDSGHWAPSHIPNCGSTRDLPKSVQLHSSVQDHLELCPDKTIRDQQMGWPFKSKPDAEQKPFYKQWWVSVTVVTCATLIAKPEIWMTGKELLYSKLG